MTDHKTQSIDHTDELTAMAQEDGLYDCCPECGGSLAECHIGDSACPECGRVVSDGGEEKEEEE
jgi:hypothetical protein